MSNKIKVVKVKMRISFNKHITEYYQQFWFGIDFNKGLYFNEEKRRIYLLGGIWTPFIFIKTTQYE